MERGRFKKESRFFEIGRGRFKKWRDRKAIPRGLSRKRSFRDLEEGIEMRMERVVLK
jgi:hypothetical protein